MLREGACLEHAGPFKSIGVNDGRSHNIIGMNDAARFAGDGADAGNENSRPCSESRQLPGKYPGLRPRPQRKDRQLEAVRHSSPIRRSDVNSPYEHS